MFVFSWSETLVGFVPKDFFTAFLKRRNFASWDDSFICFIGSYGSHNSVRRDFSDILLHAFLLSFDTFNTLLSTLFPFRVCWIRFRYLFVSGILLQIYFSNFLSMDVALLPGIIFVSKGVYLLTIEIKRLVT